MSLRQRRLKKSVTRIAPANLTLTAIRETVVALAERSTARVELTPELTAVDATDAPLATETAATEATETATPQLTEVLPTATLEEVVTRIAPANLTLTAIRETVNALAKRSTARVELTPELTAVDATAKPLATETAAADATETPTPQLTEVPPTATLEEAATRIAPANLTLTAIRETIDAVAERSTERAEATAEVTPVDATETPLATETVTAVATETATPQPTDVLPTATPEKVVTVLAPANLTLTAIRETVVALAERSTARVELTAELTPVDATDAPLASETVTAVATETATPQLTEVLPTATLEEAASLIAPANLTLTAIRETVAALAERSTARVELTPELTPVDATDAPLATETAADATETPVPSPTDVVATATPEKVVTVLAPANLTLTAIRETVVALAERSTARTEVTAELTSVDATNTPLATETVTAVATETATPQLTEVLPTATPEKVGNGPRASQSDLDGNPRNGGRVGGTIERREWN